MLDATSITLQKALEMQSRALAIHTSNVANANVPNFKTRKIDFENRMREAIGMLDRQAGTLRDKEAQAAESISKVQADVYEDPLAKASGDGNTVNLDKEQAEIAKNMIAYQGAIQLLNKKFMMERLALGEGGGGR